MATKRPLDQLEDMVNALPPAPMEKKAKKERKLKIKKPPPPSVTSPPTVPLPPVTSPPPPPPPVTTSPPPPTIDDLFNGDNFNILNLLNEPSSSYKVQLPPMEEVCQPMNCPVCQTDLVCFQARHTGENYIKCQNSQCGLFCHQDQLTTYLKIIDEKLHPDYRKKTLVCDCDEPASQPQPTLFCMPRNPRRPMPFLSMG